MWQTKWHTDINNRQNSWTPKGSFHSCTKVCFFLLSHKIWRMSELRNSIQDKISWAIYNVEFVVLNLANRLRGVFAEGRIWILWTMIQITEQHFVTFALQCINMSLDVLMFMFRCSYLDVHFLMFMFWCSSFDVHILVFIFWCSFFDVHILMFMFWCLCFDVHILVFMFWCSCFGVHILMFMLWCSCFGVHILMFMFWCSYFDVHVLVFIFWCSYFDVHILVFMFWCLYFDVHVFVSYLAVLVQCKERRTILWHYNISTRIPSRQNVFI